MSGYGDDPGFTAWLTANGYTLPVDALSAEVLRQRGSAYIDGIYGLRFSGVPTGGYAQERAWPRTGAYGYSDALPADLVPTQVIEASYYAAWAEALSPGSLSVTYTPGTNKVLTKVDKIEWDVVPGSIEINGGMSPLLTSVEGLLAPFIWAVYGLPAVLVV